MILNLFLDYLILQIIICSRFLIISLPIDSDLATLKTLAIIFYLSETELNKSSTGLSPLEYEFRIIPKYLGSISPYLKKIFILSFT